MQAIREWCRMPGVLPGITRGERLMGAFEVYRALLPDPLISLEHAILLITELAQRRTLTSRAVAAALK